MEAHAVDFGPTYNAFPAPLLILSPDWPAFTIVAANDAYLSATMTAREDILGRPLFEVFPDNPADPLATGSRNLRASLERVLASRAPNTMPVQRYDIQLRHSIVTEFEERHWAPHNAPVLNGAASLSYISHCVTDVTDVVRAGYPVNGRAQSVLRRSHVRVDSSADLFTLRETVRNVCHRRNFGDGARMDLLVVASELGRNMLVHAGGGMVDLEEIGIESSLRVRLRFYDQGPGITDLNKALTGGHSTVGTRGCGLSGSRRLVDEFNIDTGRRGTIVTVTKWRRRSP